MKRVIKATSSNMIYAGMNYDSTPEVGKGESARKYIAKEFDYIDYCEAGGVVCIRNDDEDISIFKVAPSFEAWKQSIRDQFDADVLEEQGLIEYYLFNDFYELTYEPTGRKGSADEMLAEAMQYIEETYVDNDSFANLALIDSDTMQLLISGENPPSIISQEQSIESATSYKYTVELYKKHDEDPVRERFNDYYEAMAFANKVKRNYTEIIITEPTVNGPFVLNRWDKGYGWFK